LSFPDTTNAHTKIGVPSSLMTRRYRGVSCDNPPRKVPYYRVNQSTLAIKRQ
jgi:hypothetical protein